MDIAILEKKLQEVYDALIYSGNIPTEFLEDTNDEYVCSAQNLLMYLTLRSIDLRKIQAGLTELGISSLGTSAGYVLENVSRTLSLIQLINGVPLDINVQKPSLGFKESSTLIRARSKSLFNVPGNGSRTKIMVTMPEEASFDIRFLKGLYSAGMDVLRINLSHGNQNLWNDMLDNSKRASEELQIKTSIFMDLPRSKIRVLNLYKLPRDEKGFQRTDAISISEDNRFELMKESQYNNLTTAGTVLNPRITISFPEIIDDLEVGHRIFFDDGAIEGRVTSKSFNGVIIEIHNTTKKKLRIGKGINLPDTHLSLPSLTSQDLALLPYACENADIIGYSFVRTPEDIKTLYSKLADLHDTDTGVVFKIENKEAFDNLPRILFEAMKRPKIGVMIARGDLAVEVGFDRISEVKQQIMSLCEAAHIPVIWATQVLESMAKKGMATRAEISDVVLSVQAECVMLNKGPYITETVTILKNILARMEEHSNKNKKTLRALGVARNNLRSIQTKEVRSVN
ncbi:MAG: pyruvate kinase [Maribacter sp.]|jgi:pyruvate kinase